MGWQAGRSARIRRRSWRLRISEMTGREITADGFAYTAASGPDFNDMGDEPRFTAFVSGRRPRLGRDELVRDDGLMVLPPNARCSPAGLLRQEQARISLKLKEIERDLAAEPVDREAASGGRRPSSQSTIREWFTAAELLSRAALALLTRSASIFLDRAPSVKDEPRQSPLRSGRYWNITTACSRPKCRWRSSPRKRSCHTCAGSRSSSLWADYAQGEGEGGSPAPPRWGRRQGRDAGARRMTRQPAVATWSRARSGAPPEPRGPGFRAAGARSPADRLLRLAPRHAGCMAIADCDPRAWGCDRHRPSAPGVVPALRHAGTASRNWRTARAGPSPSQKKTMKRADRGNLPAEVQILMRRREGASPMPIRAPATRPLVASTRSEAVNIDGH